MKRCRVSFRSHGRKVTFLARCVPKRRGRVPAHLKPYLFKAKKRRSSRKGKIPPQLRPFLFKPGHRRRSRRW